MYIVIVNVDYEQSLFPLRGGQAKRTSQPTTRAAHIQRATFPRGRRFSRALACSLRSTTQAEGKERLLVVFVNGIFTLFA